MDQNLVVTLIVFLQILMWDLSKTPLAGIQGKKHFAKLRMLQIEEGRMFIIFIPW